MIVVAKKSFNKDIEKVKDKKLALKIIATIEVLQNAKTIGSLLNSKKLKGSTNAYRIKIGDYRLGFFFIDKTIELTAFAHRKDIYKLFP